MSKKEGLKTKEAIMLHKLKTKYPDFWRKWYGVALDYLTASDIQPILEKPKTPEAH